VSCFLLPARIPEIILGTLHRPPEELIRLAVTPREDVLVRIVRPYPLRAHLQQDGLYSRVERDGVSFSSKLFALDSSSILLASSVSGGSPKRSRSPPTSGCAVLTSTRDTIGRPVANSFCIAS
jgi:hypothetical protein